MVQILLECWFGLVVSWDVRDRIMMFGDMYKKVRRIRFCHNDVLSCVGDCI
ncbi:hypothetical protein [Candidatus Hodgkinia cicadicola]|uniref:hypothetical protein n=1 Tax=Candidatus Hodgkinia cicadicola TaxID=573658 RepID=UPI001788CEFF